MEEKLIDAAIENNVQYLQNIDKLILHRIATRNFISTPLHAASWHGHVDFVRELLKHCPDLAGVLDQRRRSALHLAVKKGNVEVVRAILEVEEYGKDMCTVVDDEGMNPLHVAAMKGRLDVLTILMDEVGAKVALARARNGQTILHLCVLHRQKEALELLMNSECRDLINAVDDRGNTILHIAVAEKNLQIAEDLAKFKCEANHVKMKLNIKNAKEYTALDILLGNRREDETEETNRIKHILLSHKAKTARDLIEIDPRMMKKFKEPLLIVAILMTTMAFQAVISPPGGVWQDNLHGHRAGEAVMAYRYPSSYFSFLYANTFGLVMSLSVIYLILNDWSFRNKKCNWLLILVMWLTITSMIPTYLLSITVITPKRDKTIVNIIAWWVVIWFVVTLLHLMGNLPLRSITKDAWTRLGFSQSSFEP